MWENSKRNVRVLYEWNIIIDKSPRTAENINREPSKIKKIYHHHTKTKKWAVSRNKNQIRWNSIKYRKERIQGEGKCDWRTGQDSISWKKMVIDSLAGQITIWKRNRWTKRQN